MSQILGVKFNDYGQVYYFASGPFVVREGQHVIVKTDQGMGLGKVILIRQAPLENEEEDGEGFKTIYRLANEKDMESVAENEALAKDAYTFSRKCIITHKLGMKLVDVEVFFDRSKMVFYFTAPGRIDFRELIKDLVREYRTRIELRQIGVRHETQMLGAIGNCGQMCCCRRFMRKFVPVTIKMAKEQNLFLNPTKISGICGRLLCCLSFEQKGYEEFHRMCPRMGKKYATSIGSVKVLRSNFFKKTLSLLTEDYEEREVSIDEWNEIVNKPPSAEAVGETTVKSLRGRRGGRPDRTEEPQRDARNGGSPVEERDSKKPRKRGGRPERPQGGGSSSRDERNGQAGQERSDKPDKLNQVDQSRAASKDESDSVADESKSKRVHKPDQTGRVRTDASVDSSSEDSSKKSRRPRRRRRRPPKK
ncbi:MAG: hypothetical protein JEY79_06195 [Pseudodesulfovibrio sp.]|nr:hypothetical protein [Pseudodesulfovibrio sp.]